MKYTVHMHIIDCCAIDSLERKVTRGIRGCSQIMSLYSSRSLPIVKFASIAKQRVQDFYLCQFLLLIKRELAIF